jgi:hypothetical protein
LLRIIVLIVLGVALWWLLRRFFSDRDEPPPANGQVAKPEDMVVCSLCGVNMPRSEARIDAGKFFCVNNPHCPPRP